MNDDGLIKFRITIVKKYIFFVKSFRPSKWQMGKKGNSKEIAGI